jgi:hypothetical protein
MSEWKNIIESQLVPGETLLSVVEDVELRLDFVPYVRPIDNHAPGMPGVLGLPRNTLSGAAGRRPVKGV